MGAETCNFLKLLKTVIVGALWLCLGLLSMRINNDGVTAPKARSSYAGLKNRFLLPTPCAVRSLSTLSRTGVGNVVSQHGNLHCAANSVAGRVAVCSE